jgi:DNA repair exonuclease SbcCD ATPase subunit
MTAQNIDDIKIEFSEGVNVVSISDKKLFDLFKYFPLTVIYGSQQKELDQDIKGVSSTINFLPGALEREMSFINNNGKVIIKDDKIFNKESDQYREDFKSIYTFENFIISSYYCSELKLNNLDHIFEKEKIKQLLINSEIERLKFPYFTGRDKLLPSKEKEAVDLEKEKELLELKNIKKEKIYKEIHASEKTVSKIEKKRDSIINYKDKLNEIIKQINKRDKISSKISNLKKEIIELKEIKEQITSIENTISERFSHFPQKGEQLPDLELIQQSFNSFRDINEEIDNFSISKRNYSAGAMKIIFSSAIFSLIALIFLLFTSSASLVLTFISSISAGAAVLAVLVYYFKIKRLKPTKLLDKKDQMKDNLIDILKKNNFQVDDYKTGELYEILFQYFDDLINFRDINNELMSLKKKRSSFGGLAEKEEQLEQLTNEMGGLDKVINETINSLDTSIHPLPAAEDITRAVHDIDELLEENKKEIDKKSSLIAKFQEEIDEYDRDEKKSLSSEMRLEETIKRIATLTEEIKHIKFLEGIFDEAIERWSKDKLEKLADKTIENIIKITNNSDTREKLGDVIKNLIDSGALKEEYMELEPYISFAIKGALSGQLSSPPLPPIFLIDPFMPDNEFSGNMKKLLPEFFPDRQVVVIINYIDPNINGNLITL